jgi:hypothetical protein
MLARTGWRIVERFDLTPAYGAAVSVRLAEEEANAEALVELLGGPEFEDVLARRPRTASAIGVGLLRRELFATVPSADARSTQRLARPHARA